MSDDKETATADFREFIKYRFEQIEKRFDKQDAYVKWVMLGVAGVVGKAILDLVVKHA